MTASTALIVGFLTSGFIPTGFITTGFITTGIVTLGISTLGVIALVALRLYDKHAERQAWARLCALQSNQKLKYSADLTETLPEPVRRYFRYCISEGADLHTVVEISMQGLFSLGTPSNPQFRQMHAKQILAPPFGFLWKLQLKGFPSITGSDSEAWTRFRVAWLIPVARFGGDNDHARAAFGRYIAEAAFWCPAALLPGPGIEWDALGENSCRVTVTHGELKQSVNLTLADDGQPQSICFERWSNANPQKKYQLQPFGGYLSDFRWVNGYRLPFTVEAGNHFGTPDYFPFYQAKVQHIVFPAH